ncbi:MAG: hypothetical protein KDE22_06180 [Rhodobacterales bacterium]|nr:hypothetical protein [Rhodobacterales bacterium]
MQFAGAILMGAQLRLLPPSLPFRFFAAAAVYHVVLWALLALGADEVPGFVGGPGLPLAALHALTLGVLAMTAIGATLQILTVATGQALRALWPCHLVSWLYIPGVGVLLVGLAINDHLVSAAGLLPVLAALGLFGAITADLLRRAKGLRVPILYIWTALAALAGLALLGFLLVADLGHGILAGWGVDRSAIGLAHMILAVYGFMGMLALGYSQILVPMFALAQAPAFPRNLHIHVALAAALILAVVWALVPLEGLSTGGLIVAAGIGLVGAAAHVAQMVTALRTGMRKRLGLSFVLVRVSWGALVASLVAGPLALMGLLGGQGVTLWGAIALLGWLLTFLLGVLQRIIPFLVAMNASKVGGVPPRLSELAPDMPLLYHAACHAAAVVLVLVGLVADQGWPVRIGASIGVCGGLAYLWFAIAVYRRMHGPRPERGAPPPATGGPGVEAGGETSNGKR